MRDRSIDTEAGLRGRPGPGRGSLSAMTGTGAPAGGRRTAAILFLLAAAARGVAAATAAVIPEDAIALVRAARTVAGGDPGAAFRGLLHPLPPLLGGVLGGGETALVLLTSLAGGAGALAVLGIGRRLLSPATGVAAALLYAAVPALVRFGGAPLAEGLYLPLALGAVDRALRALDTPSGRGAAPLAGLQAGHANQFRPEAQLHPLVLVPGLTAARRPRRALLLLLAFAAVAGPYIGWLSAVRGTVALSPKKPVARFLAAEDSFAETRRVKAERLGIEYPGAGAAALDTLRTYGDAAAWALPPVALVGLALLLRRGRRAPALILAALVLAALALSFRLLHLHGYLERRHLLLPSALTVPLAAAGLSVLAGRRALLVAAVAAAVMLAVGTRPRDREKEPLRQAGEWIRAEAGPGAVVASLFAPRVAYYADGEDLPLHRVDTGLRAGGGDPERVRAAIAGRADYLVTLHGRGAKGGAGVLEAAAGGPPARVFGEGRSAVYVYRLRR